MDLKSPFMNTMCTTSVMLAHFSDLASHVSLSVVMVAWLLRCATEQNKGVFVRLSSHVPNSGTLLISINVPYRLVICRNVLQCNILAGVSPVKRLSELTWKKRHQQVSSRHDHDYKIHGKVKVILYQNEVDGLIRHLAHYVICKNLVPI